MFEINKMILVMKKLILFYFLFFAFNAFSQYSPARFLFGNFPNNTSQVFIEDIDQDGIDDMLIGSSENLSWSKRLSDGYSWSSNIPIFSEFSIDQKIQLVDIDGDGIKDIISLYEEGSLKLVLRYFKMKPDGSANPPIIIDQISDNFSSVREFFILANDLDEDGDMDIIGSFDMVDDNLDQLIIYENINGQLTNEIPITTGIIEPKTLHVDTLDNDGLFDIIIRSDNDSIVFLKNLGNLNFSIPINLFDNNISVKDFALGDLDGDSDLDIVALKAAQGQLTWYENLDNANFGAEQLLQDSDVSGSQNLQLEDIDGDGDLDILFMTGFSLGKLQWLENTDGLGNFDPAQIIIEEYIGTYDLDILDIDNDDDLDIVFLGYPGGLILFNTDGLGDFSSQETFLMGPGNDRSKMAFGDLSGDGLDDVVVSSEVCELAWMKYNADLQIFEKPIKIDIDFPNNISIHEIQIFDINNDGHLDILFQGGPNIVSDKLEWVFNDGNGNFIDYGFIEPSISSIDFEIIDLNNDGYKDILGTSSWTKIEVSYNLGENNGFANLEQVYSNQFTGVGSVRVKDLNADNLPEIMFSDELYGTIKYLKNLGNSFDSPELLYDHNNEILDFIVFDFDHDGIQDYVVIDESGSERIVYLEGFSYYSLHDKKNITPGFAAPKELFPFDIDANGEIDILFKNEDEFYWLEHLGYGNFGDEKNAFGFNLDEYQFFKIKDIDLDNDLDFIYADDEKVYATYNYASNGRIFPKIFFDENQNGEFDANEIYMSSFNFQLLPYETTSFSTDQSLIRYFVPNGTYELLSLPKETWTLSSDSSNCLISIESDTIINKEFGYYPDSLIQDLAIDIASGPTRCGFDVPFWLNLSNIGTTIEEGMLEFKIDNYATYISAFPAPDSISNDSYFWFFDSLYPSQNLQAELVLEVFDASFLGETLSITSKSYKEQNVIEEYNYLMEINCAYDPNDKQVTPPGFLDEHYTLKNEVLEYLIRFQNTGTDTAFNVVINDQLDANLDWESFRLLSVSHPVNIDVNYQTGNVDFRFQNILLPDSTTSEIQSHGFIKYKINQKDSLPDYTRIENTANIFFDYNAPIQTNTTFNTIVTSYPFNVESQIIHPLCFNDSTGSISLDIYAIPPVSFSWDREDISGDFAENLGAGNYEVTITDGTGNSIIESFEIIEPTELTASFETNPQVGADLGSIFAFPEGGTPPYQITWQTEPVQEGEFINELVAGNYMVSIIDSNNCMYADSVEVDFISSNFSNKKEFDWKIFPNPADEKINIWLETDFGEEFELELISTLGENIFQTNLNSGKFYSIDTSSLVEGVYLVRIRSGKDFFTQKIFIFH